MLASRPGASASAPATTRGRRQPLSHTPSSTAWPLGAQSTVLYCTSAPPSHVRTSAGSLRNIRAHSMLEKLIGLGQSKTATKTAPGAGVWFSPNAPTWEQLEEIARAKQAALGLDLWADPNDLPTNSYALKRTFGKDEPIRVKLYRDSAAWCPYCHKVWLQLEEKQIPYEIEKINMRSYGDKPPHFLAKVPSGLLPVLELDGRVVTESVVIMNLLEQGSAQRLRADTLMRLERRFFSDWLGWLTSDWSHEQNKARFEACLDTVEKELKASGGPFFLGPELSLVDITFVPMMERAAASLAYYKGFYMRGSGKWPAIEAWFNALEERPTYLGTRSDYYTHAHDLPPQLGGCGLHPEGVSVADFIDGGAWKLPLAPLSATSLPEPYAPGDNPTVDTLQAAVRLIRNNVAVTRFSLRGPGKPGPRPVSAPLADPTAIPAEEFSPQCDMAMRHVAHALLVGVEAKQVSPQALQVTNTQPPGTEGSYVSEPIVKAARYLRDRVSVPRDLRFPAARQLRAHLTWLMDTLSA